MMKKELIEKYIHNHPDIRAVGIEGSKSTGKQDAFSDIDITLFTTKSEYYIGEDAWLDFLGERIIMQKPGFIHLKQGQLLFPYLMLFENGERVDLKIADVSAMEAYMEWDSTVQIIMDLDQRVQGKRKSDESSFFIELPNEEEFLEVVNEFFWLVPSIVKGCERKQFVYAVSHVELIRQQLLTVISWSIAKQYEERVNLGSYYKYLPQFMEPIEHEKLQLTYNCSSFSQMKQSLIVLIDLMERFSRDLATDLNFQYAEENDQVVEYVKKKIWM